MPGRGLGLENSHSSFVVFYLKAKVGAAVVGTLFFQLWVVPGTLFSSHVDLTFMDCILYPALAGERAELNPAQSVGLSQELCTFPAYLPSSLRIFRAKVAEEIPGVTLRVTDSENCGPADVEVTGIQALTLQWLTHHMPMMEDKLPRWETQPDEGPYRMHTLSGRWPFCQSLQQRTSVSPCRVEMHIWDTNMWTVPF